MTKHDIEPVYDQDSRILILGSFPSIKSREAKFFYHHPQNRFWKLLAALFQEEVPQTIEQKKELLIKHHLALWDVIESCEIKGSSDASITNVKVNDIIIVIFIMIFLFIHFLLPHLQMRLIVLNNLLKNGR